MSGISATPEWKALAEHAKTIKDQHLRELLKDAGRSKALTKSFGSLYVDFSRQNASEETLAKLLALAETAKVSEKIKAMFEGVHLNTTENRAVLHVALRAARDASIVEGGKNVVPEVWAVRDKIAAFASKIRSGEWKGATGKPLTTAVAIGIGGSYLGPLFAHAALAHDPTAAAAAAGRDLRFLANVDPVDAVKALSGLDPETTLVVIVSKTFTTAETMRNARTARAWIVRALGADAVAKHMVAVSTNLEAVEKFGIDPENAFGFWDWVGGRYSVTSAVGVLPLSLQYGTEVVDAFLEGARQVDEHYRTAPLADNIPALLGLFNVWNATFLGRPTVAVLPYQQALQHLAPHVQQLSMESNGKGVALDGSKLPYEAGEIVFGEPGTNGQHSFYQLVHQGRVVPAEFIGAAVSQQDVHLAGDGVTSHEELMANFFAQPDALALGKTPEELRAAGVPEPLVPHKTFEGNRPSLSILVPSVNASSLGQLLALYEHRVATSGFVWDINSFDQWGVELGKALATKVRKTVEAKRKDGAPVTEADGYNASSVALLNKFLELSQRNGDVPAADVFPPALA